MSWVDRLREAAYTSPSGTRLLFKYEDVSKSFEKKTTAFEFPDANGTYIQDMGHSGRRYPMRLFFWGDDYDTESDLFESLLSERGTGRLDHPIYGSVDVVPFGAVSRRDDLKTGANQAVFDVTFWETIGLIYPTGQTDPASELLTALDEYNAAVSSEFDNITSLDTAIEQSTLKNSYLALLDTAKSELNSIADTQDDVRTQFNTITDSINQGIDILIAEPLSLAFQTTLMIEAPARALTSITDRLQAYGDLAGAIVSGNGANVTTPGNDSRNSNLFHTDSLYASTYTGGSILSVINNRFTTKTEALEAADSILTQFEDLTTWRDANFASLQETDTGASYQQLQEAVALTAGFLVEISFSLKQEHAVTLTRNRTIVDLAAELYGDVDSELDFLISSNNLSGSEILELPAGREIVYFI